MTYAYARAGLLAAPRVGGRRIEADFLHLRHPFPVVVVTAPRRTELVLPQMRHFMPEGRERFPHRIVREMQRVDADFVDRPTVAVPPRQAMAETPLVQPLALAG